MPSDSLSEAGSAAVTVPRDLDGFPDLRPPLSSFTGSRRIRVPGTALAKESSPDDR
ncbi:hypothetical protein GCM10010275_41850 [Streptomyces litmocidini]|nr:hypothetical protein GCM10010275_41850 [Streptomyces litmocidini]